MLLECAYEMEFLGKVAYYILQDDRKIVLYIMSIGDFDIQRIEEFESRYEYLLEICYLLLRRHIDKIILKERKDK